MSNHNDNQTPQGFAKNTSKFIVYLVILLTLLAFAWGGGLAVIAPLPGA